MRPNYLNILFLSLYIFSAHAELESHTRDPNIYFYQKSFNDLNEEIESSDQK